MAGEQVLPEPATGGGPGRDAIDAAALAQAHLEA
jgi:hypothetical protein